MMEERYVLKRGWLTVERFLDLLGAASLLPGPSSTEVAIYVGEIRGGVAGLVVAGACFILPAAVLVTALVWAYLKYGAMPQVVGLLFGIKPVALALIAQASWNLGRTALNGVWLGAVAIAAIALAVCGASPLIVLIGAGVLWALIREGKKLAQGKAAVAGLLGTGAGGTSAAVGVPGEFRNGARRKSHPRESNSAAGFWPGNTYGGGVVQSRGIHCASGLHVWRCGKKLGVRTAVADDGHCVGARNANHREIESAGAGRSVQRVESHESGDAEPVCERAAVRNDHHGNDAGTRDSAERQVVVLRRQNWRASAFPQWAGIKASATFKTKTSGASNL
jgi:chromate transport protein ChrA